MNRKLLGALLSIPATLVWVPICAHYLFVLGLVSGVFAVGGLPAGVPWTPAVLSLAGFVLSCGGLVGLLALWAMILKGAQIASADKWARTSLLCGLWIGFITSLIALALAGSILWESGFNLFIHSLFFTVFGPIIVFLRERHRIRLSESSAASA
ncbi:MAG: hypothetical protein V3T83_19915 [Acidobacteriota bacterium]